MGDQRKCFFHYAIDINIGKFGGAGARKVKEIIYDFAGAEGLLDDLVDNVVPGIILGHLLGKHLNVVGDDGKRRVDFVGDAGSEKAERSELLRLRHLLFHALALRDIVEKQEAANALTGFADQRGNRDVESKEFSLVMEPLLPPPGAIAETHGKG